MSGIEWAALAAAGVAALVFGAVLAAAFMKGAMKPREGCAPCSGRGGSYCSCVERCGAEACKARKIAR